MSYRLGLRIGESFAEIRAVFSQTQDKPTSPEQKQTRQGGEEILLQERWYLPKKGLAEGLKAALETLAAKHGKMKTASLQIVTTRVERTLSRKQGQLPAFLVTAGFESALRLKQPFTTQVFAPNPDRAWLPFSTETTFGIDERIASDGTVVKALQEEELEFLVSKLELVGIKNVALGFLHAGVNPAHELQAASYLRDRGLNVFLSHELGVTNEIERWQKTLETAYAETPALEEQTLIEDTLKSVFGAEGATWTTELWTASGLQASPRQASSSQGGFYRALLNQAQAGKDETVLHFGLEGFYLLTGCGQKLETLPIHATNQIELGPWLIPSYSRLQRGYEPGPMLFGKSHHLTSLDVLYARNHLGDIEALTSLTTEKSRGRIKETLYTLGKMIPVPDAKSSPDADHVSEDLEHALSESVAGCLARAGIRGKVVLSGALAQAFFPLLKKRRPDLTFLVAADADWSESNAALARPLSAAKGARS